MQRGRGDYRGNTRGRREFIPETRSFNYNYSNNMRGQYGNSMRCFRCGENHRIEDCLKPQRINDEKDGKKYVRVTLEESEWKRICELREEEVMRKKIEADRKSVV